MEKSKLSAIRNRESMLASKRKYNNSEKSKKVAKKSRMNKPQYKNYLKWCKDNPEKLKEYGLKRANKNHKITKLEWKLCKDYFNNECAYCGLSIENHHIKYKGEVKLSDFHKEHVIHNGKNNLSNCVPSCKNCNVKKWEYNFEYWYNENNPVFSVERLNRIHQWLNGDYKIYLHSE